MTDKEKAKAYDESIERAKRVLLDCTSEERKVVEYITPELKESESDDEKIRKKLIQYFQKFNLDTFAGIDPKKILVWLESQGAHTALSKDEQNKLAKGVLRSCAFSFINYLDSHRYEGKMDVSSGECGDIENAFQNAMWDRLHRYYCKYIEKQGEQKPTDNIEPKFKVGDIVKHKDNPHLTYILKRFTDDGDYEFHAIGKDGNEGCTCFAVVKYQDEWELVERKPVIEMKTTEESLGVDSDTYNKIVDECVYGEQNHAWSEEDEKQARQIERIVHNDGCTQKLQKQISDWFKSLKGRVQPKPMKGLSEEDESIVTELIGIFESAVDGGHVSFPYRLIKDYIRVLKSCLYQTTWKPTERMLEALKWAKCEFHPDCPEIMEQLKYLYQELKQLYYDRT